MRVRRAALILTVLASGVCHAQDPAGLFVGMAGGYGFGVQSSERVPVYAVSEECGVFTEGGGREFFLAGRFFAPSLFSGSIGLAGELAVVTSRGALVATPLDPLLVFDETTGRGIEVGHEYRFNQESQQVQLALAGTYAFGSGGSVRLGGWIGYRNQGRLWQIDTITSGQLRYDSLPDPSAREMIEGERLSLNRTALGAIAGVSWRWKSPFSSKVWLEPELFIRADLVSLANERRWQAFGGGFSLALLVDVSPAEAVVPPADTFPPDRRLPPPMPRAGRVTAQIDLYGTDENDRRLPAVLIRVFETYRRVRTGRLNEIRFERGGSGVPQYYPELSGGARARFLADSIHATTPSDLRRHILNIIGERMSRNARASLILKGSALRGERSSLADARAREVERYLGEIWGIDTGRMEAVGESGRGGTNGSARVQIESSEQEITLPAVYEQVERSLDPPLIALDPVYEAEAGVREWRITLSHDGREIGRISSNDGEDDASGRLDWKIIDSDAAASHSMLVADLTVEDSAGTAVSARAQTPMTIERQTRVIDRWEQEDGTSEMVLYTLYPFESGAVNLRERNREVIREIVANTRGGASVVVIDASANDLSARRAESVADALRAAFGGRGPRVSVTRDLPIAPEAEGMLGLSSSRGVMVVVQQDLPAGP